MVRPQGPKKGGQAQGPQLSVWNNQRRGWGGGELSCWSLLMDDSINEW